MQRPDTEDGLFHEGNPTIGQKGTPVPAGWLNALLQISTIFRGEAEPPDPELGDDNDLYIATPTRNFYDKVDGEWVGPWVQGVAGPQGIQGPAGSAQAAFWADIINVAVSTVLAAYDVIIRVPADAAGDVTLTFPTAVGKKGRVIGVKNKSAFNAICQGSGGQTVDDSADGVTFAGGGEGWIFMSDGANWESVGRM